MRAYLFLLLLACLPAVASAKSGTVMYVCAHPDDCILFMNPNLYDDVTREADKVVVVYLTSGDSGMPYPREGEPETYPYVRERASNDAMQWMVDVDKEHRMAQSDAEAVRVGAHDIERVSYGNTVTYFLRLPDGNFGGNGFELYKHASLHKLKAGDIATIAPIDGGAPYNGWNDVVAVLTGIIGNETKDQKRVALHIQDPDVKNNTDDHSDHTTGATAVMEALAKNPAGQCYTIHKHIDYSIAQKPLNLEGTGLQNKAGSFAVLTATQQRFLDHHDWNEGHTAYLTRNYFTTITLPEGCDK